jgi:hypothetical protein
MGAHDSAAVNKDQHETGKVVDAVIEDQQLVMRKVHELAVTVRRNSLRVLESTFRFASAHKSMCCL